MAPASSGRHFAIVIRVHHCGTIEGKLLETFFQCAVVTLFITKGPKRFNDVADPMIVT